MEEQVDYDQCYDPIVEMLVGMFGEVLNRDAIASIVVSCNGDLEEAANIIMNVTSEDGADSSVTGNEVEEEERDCSLLTSVEQIKISNTTSNYYAQENSETASKVTGQQNTMAYSKAIQSHASSTSTTGTLPKQTIPKTTSSKEECKELKQILKYHEDGIRTLIFMRGPPGSGKSHLSKEIVDKIYNSHVPIFWNTHIFSADDYFLRNGRYCFDRSGLPHAHEWNRKRSFVAMSRGVSPVIIDNTNTELWEMEPYVREGIKNSYVVIFLEPNTPWAWNVRQLARKNIHNVPAHSIERKINTHQRVTESEYLNMLGYGNYIKIIPTIRRKIPELSRTRKTPQLQLETCASSNMQNKNEEKEKYPQNAGNSPDDICPNDQRSPQHQSQMTSEKELKEVELKEHIVVYEEIQKRLDEVAEIENEWDHGENWDTKIGLKEANKVSQFEQVVMPQRNVKSVKSVTSDKTLSSFSNVQDWTTFMPTWNEQSPSHVKQPLFEPVEKVSSSTCMEIGDTDLSSYKNPLKIITAIPRDINEFYISDKHEKIPEIRMLDKGTSTNNDTMMPIVRCKNEEKHFSEFRKLFKYLPIAVLRDVFDQCQGDVNWAVDIVLSDLSGKEFHTNEDDLVESDNDEENNCNDLCECMAAYNIIPDQNTTPLEDIKSEIVVAEVISSPVHEKRKIKRDPPLKEAILLKQQIEQNIVISDDHYSQHSLKIRKIRRGEIDEPTINTEFIEQNEERDLMEENLASSSQLINEEISDDETASTVSDVEKTISIDLCKDLVSQMDEHYGWKDMMYSNNISTRVNIPVSILNELNAIWIESLMFQLEENRREIDMIVKQDEEFARELAYKEAELLQTGNEPQIPDFKEVMDMDFALSLYHKDVEQWRNNEPKDIAAIMTKDKLKCLFPELSEDSLVEILMAHDNNFQATVESLLISTGREEILLINNGISKFIMEKENEVREKVMTVEHQELSEEEWPSLSPSREISMEVVNQYRQEAENHLKYRNMNHQKAQDLMRRGMTPAATFFNDISTYHKLKYEYFNSYAAATLIQLHARKSADSKTVDLHFLHVNEAREALDIFLDRHIQALRKNGPRNLKLFFITGRGAHSHGQPRIKPATKRRLRERGLRYSESNPGLLTAKVKPESLLSTEL